MVLIKASLRKAVAVIYFFKTATSLPVDGWDKPALHSMNELRSIVCDGDCAGVFENAVCVVTSFLFFLLPKSIRFVSGRLLSQVFTRLIYGGLTLTYEYATSYCGTTPDSY